MPSIDPRQRLDEAKAAARAGRYDEALQGYVWFHEHALEHDRAFYGVRLSFALTDWMELAEDYPPALTTLQGIRDRKVEMLRAGEGDRETFDDVIAINQELDQDAMTAELFAELAARQPSLASQCFTIALPALVSTGAYELARQHLVDPQFIVDRWAAGLNEGLANDKWTAPVHAAFIHNYVGDVSGVLRVLREVGDVQEAERVGEISIAAVDSSAREWVRTALAEREVEEQ